MSQSIAHVLVIVIILLVLIAVICIVKAPRRGKPGNSRLDEAGKAGYAPIFLPNTDKPPNVSSHIYPPKRNNDCGTMIFSQNRSAIVNGTSLAYIAIRKTKEGWYLSGAINEHETAWLGEFATKARAIMELELLYQAIEEKRPGYVVQTGEPMNKNEASN